MTAQSLEQELIDEYGPYASISKVWKRMSFSSADAARKAADRGLVPIACFPLPYRRGRFVRTTDLARWLYAALHAQDGQPPH